MKMKRLQNFINTTFLGGFIVLLPLAIVVFLTKSLVGVISKMLKPIALLIHNTLNVELPPLFYDVIAFVLVISLFFFLGLFVRTRIGKNLFDSFENQYLSKLPFYSVIKKTVQQFSGIQKMPFSEVVLVDAYGTGMLMTGFITDSNPSTGHYTVFVPTAPNPTNGFIFHAQEHQITHTPHIKTEDAMRTIIGMGVGSEKVFGWSKKDEKPS
ncbi:MAG TPA: DUF502 domain-containing protein [Saprospiraceae bacterium]|nr:DUF502 domain-containing protein [Saprospiraceae bacterium]